jgi:hypothetical protein
MSGEEKPSTASSSPAAIRQRRRRDRRRRSIVVVSVEIGPSVLDVLTVLGLLTKTEQTSAPIVRGAFGRFVNAALRNAEKLGREASHS